jgi:hypothetical protein
VDAEGHEDAEEDEQQSPGVVGLCSYQRQRPLEGAPEGGGTAC